MATLKYYSGVDFAKVLYFKLVGGVKDYHTQQRNLNIYHDNNLRRMTLLIMELISGGGGVAENAGDVAAASQGEHEDYPCKVQP